MSHVEIEAYLGQLTRDGVLLADAAERAGLEAGVPGCPAWQVRDLLRHQAYVHAWAARHVRDRLPELDGEATEADVLHGGPADGDLLRSYRQGHAALVSVLRAADPEVSCATFMPAPSPLAFWARRQAHETAVHRYDAQSAEAGQAPDPVAAFPAGFAADGIDELVLGFAARRRYRLRGDGSRSLAVRPADVPGGWRVRLADGETTVSRDAAGQDADCVLAGPAAGLYAFLWNRCDAGRAGITVAGDPSVLGLWTACVRVTW